MADLKERRRRWRGPALGGHLQRGARFCFAAHDGEASMLGLTATPCRGDGRGLGGIFKTMVGCPQVPDLIEQGYLVKSRVYAPVDPDLRGVRTHAGDYVEAQLAE